MNNTNKKYIFFNLYEKHSLDIKLGLLLTTGFNSKIISNS